MANTRSSVVESAADCEIVISRVFAAPRARVWAAWADPRQVSQWWGPKGFRSTITEMDLRAGGMWRLVMHGPDGTDYPNEMKFVEVVPRERVVFRTQGGKTGAPVEHFDTTMTFEDHDGGTRLTISMTFATAEARDYNVRTYGAIEGGEQMFDRLENLLGEKKAGAGDETLVPLELEMRRVFAAPLAVVFKAWTDPKQVAKWWGSTGFTNPVCEMDVRPGGKIRIDMHAPDGVVHPMTGEFEEVSSGKLVSTERIVFTSAAMDGEGKPIFVNRNTVVFTVVEGGTEVALHVNVISTTASAMQYIKGMSQGWSLSLDRLAESVKAAARGSKLP